MTDDMSLTPEQIDAIKGFGDDTDALIAAARDEASPLHALFGWDEGEGTDEARQALAEELVLSANPPSARAAGGEDDEAAAVAEGDPAPVIAEGEPAPTAGEGGTAA